MKELLREHDSHVYTALAGYTYVPSEIERAVWSITPKKKGYENYIPWTDARNDLMRPDPRPVIHDEEWKRRRRHFKQQWGEPLSTDEQ